LCIIAGGSAGIGRATALELARRGASVIIASRRPATGQAAAKSIIGMTVVMPLAIYANEYQRFRLIICMARRNSE